MTARMYYQKEPSDIKVEDTCIDHRNIAKNGGDGKQNISQLFIRSKARAFVHLMRLSHQKILVKALTTNVT